ncbi:hypothetical protein MJ559_11075 [Klebsiella pneumoniae]|nr:hypothetical protein MJ559_11075 [Klebsiella pneumoniae]
MDFGTRRRFSREVQEGIVRRLQQEPWFVGTSNYDLARRLNLTPMGTRPMSGSRPTSRSAPALPAASGRPLPPGWKSIPTSWASR